MSIFDALKRLFMGGGASGAGHADADMISCEDALAVLYEFLDGELEDVSAERVKDHFDICVRCYPALKFEESFRTAVHRASQRGVAPPELKARLADLLAEASET